MDPISGIKTSRPCLTHNSAVMLPMLRNGSEERNYKSNKARERGLFELKRGFPAYDSIPDQRADLV